MIKLIHKPSHGRGWALALILVLPALSPGAEPQIRFATLQAGKPLVVEVTGVPGADLDRLRRAANIDWSGLLSVRVAGGSAGLLGSYSVTKDAVRFESRFPPTAGLKFRAEFDPKKVPGRADGHLVAAEAAVAKPSGAASTAVERIYPSADKLPENQLRFYLHFSAPMSRHDAYAHLALLDESGKKVAGPFLELGEELWDAAGKRFTLYLHPGRVKRGLKPREELGPVLEEGKRYTLVVDATWPDAEGNALKSEFRKTFRVGAPDETQPDPKKWKLAAPAAGTAHPFEVRIEKPLDHALLHRLLWVVDAGGRRLGGAAVVGDGEQRWTFKPAEPWKAGRYRLMVDVTLEDPAGNSIERPFELDLVEPRPRVKSRQVELGFVVK